MTGEPVVSVIVPVYNVEPYLERCLSSLVSQTLKDIEIIIIDDGSTDKSAVICDSYSASDDRVKVIHKENKGLAVARNEGVKASHGIYILDSRDTTLASRNPPITTVVPDEPIVA